MNFNFNAPEYQEGYTCNWDFGDGTPVAEGFNVYHSYAEEGEYLVVMTLYDEQGNLIFRKEFTVNTGNATGITDPAGDDMPYVYPVPATHELFIALSMVSPQPATIQVFNTSGQQVMSKAFDAPAGSVTLSLDVSDLPAGVYYGILVSDSSGNKTFRFIK